MIGIIVNIYCGFFSNQRYDAQTFAPLDLIKILRNLRNFRNPIVSTNLFDPGKGTQQNLTSVILHKLNNHGCVCAQLLYTRSPSPRYKISMRHTRHISAISRTQSCFAPRNSTCTTGLGFADFLHNEYTLRKSEASFYTHILDQEMSTQQDSTPVIWHKANNHGCVGAKFSDTHYAFSGYKKLMHFQSISV